jgi:hypothetical protein
MCGVFFVFVYSGAKIPFTLPQLSEMGRTLCEATLGVIDIMNHEIRTTTVPNYDLRSKVAKVRLGENEMYSKDKWNELLEVRVLLAPIAWHQLA